MFGFVSLWRSEGHECQCHSRAEGEGTADDNEKHDTYKSITDAGLPLGPTFWAIDQMDETERLTDFSSHQPLDLLTKSCRISGLKCGLYQNVVDGREGRIVMLVQLVR